MPWSEKDVKGESSFEYVFECFESRAGYTEYNKGQTCLWILEGEKEYANGKKEPGHIWLTVGDFEPADEAGTRFVHVSGDETRRMGASCKARKFIDSALEAGVPLKDKGDDSLDAGMFAGSRYRIVEETKEYEIKGQKQTGNQPLVVEYLGELSEEAPSQAPAKEEESNGSDDSGLLALAKALKAEGKDHVDFAMKATREMDVPLSDPRLAETGKESVWAKA